MKYYIGIDLGGTHIKAGLVDEEYHILKVLTRPTEGIGDVKMICNQIIQMTWELLESRSVIEFDVISMGIGVPGTVDKSDGRIVYANNLSLRNAEFKSHIKEEFEFPVYMDNDANTAAWAEYVAGSAQDATSLVFITLGTGIGAGIVINDRLFAGCNGGAGEIGHMTIKSDGPLCNCGRYGCFENYASASALIEQAREAMKNDKSSLLWEMCNQEALNLNGEGFFNALNAKDTTAVLVYNQYIRYLTDGMVNLINIFQPDVICIGGGISKVGDVLLKPLESLVQNEVYTRDGAKQTQIRIAKLTNDAGILGAALLRE